MSTQWQLTVSTFGGIVAGARHYYARIEVDTPQSLVGSHRTGDPPRSRDWDIYEQRPGQDWISGHELRSDAIEMAIAAWRSVLAGPGDVLKIGGSAGRINPGRLIPFDGDPERFAALNAIADRYLTAADSRAYSDAEVLAIQDEWIAALEGAELPSPVSYRDDLPRDAYLLVECDGEGWRMAADEVPASMAGVDFDELQRQLGGLDS